MKPVCNISTRPQAPKTEPDHYGLSTPTTMAHPSHPSNMAWRGWVTSKTMKLKINPIRGPQHPHDFSLSENERPRRRPIQTARPRSEGATTRTPNELSGTSDPPTLPFLLQPPPWGKFRRNRRVHTRHTQTTHEITPTKNKTIDRTPTLTSTPHDSYVFSHDIYIFSHDIAFHAYTDWEMKAG